MLADRWEISDDHLMYTFYLKKNIKWEDGYPFTAKDVLFSFDRIMDPKVDAAHLRNYYQDIQKVEALDDYTVRFHYRIPYFRALEFCGGIPIVPAHLFKEGEDFNEHPIGRKPVGTGPYKFLHWETGKEIALERNENYWGEKPALKRIVFKMITDPTAGLQVLKQGGLDEMGLRPIQWEKQTENKRFNENFQKLSYYLPSYSYIGWNMRRPIFSDKRVRQAMTMLVDRELFLKKILFGLGTIVNRHFLRKQSGIRQGYKALSLRSGRGAGIAQVGGLGLCEWGRCSGKGWKALRIRISPFSRVQDRRATGDHASGEFEGRSASECRFANSSGRFLSRGWKMHDFDACTMSWGLGWESDPYQLWHSSMAVQKGSNFVGFKNAEADRLIDEARREFDPQKRYKLYYRLQEIMHEEQPYTFLFTTKALVAVSRRFHNVVVYPMGLAPCTGGFRKMSQKYLDP